MVSQILKVYYDSKGYPFKDRELSVRFPIIGNAFQGASNTTEIHFYIGEIGDENTTWVALTKLPNGKTGSRLLTCYQDNEGLWYAKLQLNSFYTQYKGDIYISLQGFNGGIELEYDSGTDTYTPVGDAVIQATGSVKITIAYATGVLDGGEYENITLPEIAAAIGERLAKNSGAYLKVVTNTNLINTETYKDYLNSGDIVYCLNSGGNEVGRLVKLSGTYPNFVATNVKLNINELNVLSVFANHVSSSTIGTQSLSIDDSLDIDENAHVNLGSFSQIKDSDHEDLATFVQRIADETNEVVFGMSASPMSLTDEQFSLLTNNNNIRIAYTYSGRNYLFDKVMNGGALINDLYVSNRRIDTSVGSGAGQYEQETYVVIQLNKLDKELVATTIQRNLYLKNQTDTLLNLKADKSDTYTKSEVNQMVSGVYHYSGSKTVAQINALTGMETGDVYNVTDSGTIALGNFDVIAGDNIAWTGEEWDKLGGSIDWSAYDEKFMAAGFFEVSNYNQTTGEITFTYATELYDMSYDSDTGILTIQAN